MAKEISALIKLQIRGGAANPSPPVGPALGAKGVNIMDFCKQFNGRTQEKQGKLLPVVITVFADKSFNFIIKTPPASFFLKKATNIKSGSQTTGMETVAQITSKKIEEIALAKMKDLNANTVEGAMKIIMGSARSMGIEEKD